MFALEYGLKEPIFCEVFFCRNSEEEGKKKKKGFWNHCELCENFKTDKTAWKMVKVKWREVILVWQGFR